MTATEHSRMSITIKVLELLHMPVMLIYNNVLLMYIKVFGLNTYIIF